MRIARILGSGSYAPSPILTNLDLEQLVETSDEWITIRTGIKERRVAPKEEVTSSLAIEASRRALEDGGVDAREVELIILGTCTPDMIFPATACFVQAGIGATNAAAFDLSAGCSGFLYSLAMADSLIRCSRHNTVLVIGVEIMTRIVDWTDRNTCILFGDGAGAVVVRGYEAETRTRGILSNHLWSDGNGAKHLYGPGGGTLHPASHETVDQRLHCIKMDGQETFKGGVRAMTEATHEALRYNGYRPEDVDLFIPHQANKRIINAVAERVRIPQERTFVNVEKYGNTSAASIPLALDEALRQNRIREGDLVLLASFGAGFTWASILIRW